MTGLLVEQPQYHLLHGRGKRFFSSLKHSNWGEADYCLPSSAEDKTLQSYTSTSPCAFVVCAGALTVLQHIQYRKSVVLHCFKRSLLTWAACGFVKCSSDIVQQEIIYIYFCTEHQVSVESEYKHTHTHIQ